MMMKWKMVLINCNFYDMIINNDHYSVGCGEQCTPSALVVDMMGLVRDTRTGFGSQLDLVA